jgi:secreted Zn-dependent insulinase-like peptidase
VATLVFQALSFYRSNPMPNYLYDEMQQIALLDYSYPSRADLMEYVADAADGIMSEGLCSWPEKTELLPPFQPKAVQEILDMLKASTCQYTLIAPAELTQIKDPQREPWLGCTTPNPTATSQVSFHNPRFRACPPICP